MCPYWLLLLLLIGTSFSTSAQTSISLPLEILGSDGYTVSITFPLSNAREADALYLQLHRPAYRDASINPERGAKASVRLNDGPWIDLDDSTVTCYEPEASYGGLGGGFRTVRLTLPVRGAVAGQNTLHFRFNGTDGFTSGYRVLDVNLMQGQQKLLPDSLFVQNDPATWQPPLDNPPDIARGKELWQGAELVDYPGGPPIRATCADCHAQDGRDLEYFAYSNHSIQERAQFHGLDTRQARQIASYIRSLKDAEGVERLGRPWNPPYQPGTELEGKPVSAWAAGAGLSAVGNDERATVEAWLGKDPKPADIEAIVDVDTAIDLTKIPLSVQFPDWNAWLPSVHPKDAWPIGQFQDSPLATAYATLTAELAGSDPAQVVRTDSYLERVNGLDLEAERWLSVGRRDGDNRSWKTQESTTLDAVRDRFSREHAKQGVAHWVLVKYWELMQTYALEDQARSRWPGADPWQWPMTERAAHQIAPHIIADDFTAFAENQDVVGYYESSIWYQLQTVLNSGQGLDVEKTNVLGPTHYQYGVRLIQDLNREALGQRWEGARWYLNLAKMYQVHSNGNGPTKLGWMMRFVHPTMILGEEIIGTRYPTDLDRYGDNLSGQVQDALLKTWLKEVNRYPDEAWTRREPNEIPRKSRAWYTIESAEDVPKPLAALDRRFGPNRRWSRLGFYYLHYAWDMIPRLEARGIPCETVRAFADWGQKMWPQADWRGRATKDCGETDDSETTYTYVVRARGRTGNEIIGLAVDGQQVVTFPLTQQLEEYVYEGSETGQVRITFADSAEVNGDVQVDQVQIGGQWYEAEAQAVNTATFSKGTCSADGYSEWMYCAGYIVFATEGLNQDATAQTSQPAVAKASAESFSLYPNPANDQVTLRFRGESEGHQPVRLLVSDLTGRVVDRREHVVVRGENRYRIEVGSLPRGTYVVRLIGYGSPRAWRFVLQ